MAKKRLKRHVHRTMTRRLKGAKKSCKGLFHNSRVSAPKEKVSE